MVDELVGGDELVRRYEELRAAVLGGPDRGTRHGWAVLARAGMAAWLAAVTRITVRAPKAAGHQPPASVSTTVATEVVHALAQMVFAAAGGCRSG